MLHEPLGSRLTAHPDIVKFREKSKFSLWF